MKKEQFQPIRKSIRPATLALLGGPAPPPRRSADESRRAPQPAGFSLGAPVKAELARPCLASRKGSRTAHDGLTGQAIGDARAAGEPGRSRSPQLTGTSLSIELVAMQVTYHRHRRLLRVRRERPRSRTAEQRYELAAFDHARTIGRSPNSRESGTNSTNTSTRR
jgi:hypothetical protein